MYHKSQTRARAVCHFLFCRLLLCIEHTEGTSHYNRVGLRSHPTLSPPPHMYVDCGGTLYGVRIQTVLWYSNTNFLGLTQNKPLDTDVES